MSLGVGLKRLLFAALVVGTVSGLRGGPDTPIVTLRIEDRARHAIPRAIFGQFLERATWNGEMGPEAALDLSGRLREDVKKCILAMRIPLMRFPGGSNVDHQSWTDLIDHVPGRDGPRPPTTWRNENNVPSRFGLEEYFSLAREVGCETILVVNFLDAISKKKPLAEAALEAAGLVAYANAPIGARLPEGMPDWPSIRARNGHPEPHRVRYFQIGNEWWMKRSYGQAAAQALGTSDPVATAAWFIQCAREYIRLMKAVDPDIRLIVEGTFLEPEVWRRFHADEVIGRETDYFSAHFYSPMGMRGLFRLGKAVEPADVDPEEWWNFLATRLATPGGENRFPIDSNKMNPWREFGKPAAITEWNWNGWSDFRGGAKPPFHPLPAAGVAVAAAFHGMMRNADAIALATQSMLVGNAWDITAVRCRPGDVAPAGYLPQGLVAKLYSTASAEDAMWVDSSLEGVPELSVVLSANADESPDDPGGVRFPVLDVVVTRHSRAWHIHAVHRGYRNAVGLRMEFPLTTPVGPQGLHRLIELSADGLWEGMEISTRTVPSSEVVVLPPRSVSVITVPWADP